MMTVLADVVNMVSGDIPLEQCEALYDIARELPEEAVILDLFPGRGRSSIVSALGMRDANLNGSLFALDPHLPYKDGSLGPFLESINRYSLAGAIVPIIGQLSAVTKVLNKKSANLVIVQVPKHAGFIDDFLSSSLEAARYVLRVKGRIIFFFHEPSIAETFDNLAGIHDFEETKLGSLMRVLAS